MITDRLVRAPSDAGARGAVRRRRVPRPVLLVLAAWLFVLAIELMKAGASGLVGDLRASGLLDDPASALGIGWLASYVVLSGSPVAAAAVSLRSSGAIDDLQTLSMLGGSRLGASFVVLVVGFAYALRGRRGRESIAMGVLAISVSAALYVPAIALAWAMLRIGAFSGLRWTSSGEIAGAVDVGWGWVTGPASSALPAPLLLGLGVGVVVASFKGLDAVLPVVDGEAHADGRQRWLRSPWTLFLLGCAAALLTLSVSVAITVLVPLAAKGRVGRREAIPYIAGANVTTLADTLVAAMVLGAPGGVRVVAALAAAVVMVTLALLGLASGPLQRDALRFDDWVVASPSRTWAFTGVLFAVPLTLVAAGRLIG